MRQIWRGVGKAGKARGQALPEFALTLPIFLLILLIAVDFGRAFSSWVAINNAARVAANYAASVPNAMFGPGSQYETTVQNESNLSGCVMTGVAQPTFSPDRNVGATATVKLTCQFKLLTPFIGGFLGDPVPLSAQSQFTVRGGTIAGVPVPPPQPCDATHFPIPNLVGLTVAAARAQWSASVFIGSFTPSTGVPNKIVTGQVPDVGACRLITQTMFVTHT
ncbi:MAG: pilus assembly protein [Chloroflexi bacterium]|nr:pilus assembly protein [Chloroflexota bacterium]